jgi:hypothetical protein
MNVWRLLKGIVLFVIGVGMLWFATDQWLTYHTPDVLTWTYEESIRFSEGLSYVGWGMGAFFTGLGLFVIYLGKKELYVSDKGKVKKEILD